MGVPLRFAVFPCTALHCAAMYLVKLKYTVLNCLRYLQLRFATLYYR